MNRYLKLVHMEVHRFRWVMATLMGLTALCQLISLVWTSRRALELKEFLRLQEYGSSFMTPPPDLLTFEWVMFNSQMWFILPVLISIGVLGVYVFFIWYRDWFGRHTFIYRLLVLPTARRHLYFAKITAILMFVFGMVSFQLVLLPVEHFVFKLSVPAEHRADSHIIDVISSNQALVELIPRQFEQFFYSYGLGTIVVLAVFTAILLERSYRRLGILYGLFYLAACGFAVVFPALFLRNGRLAAYIFPSEVYVMELIVCAVVAVVSIWLGIRLLAKKITV